MRQLSLQCLSLLICTYDISNAFSDVQNMNLDPGRPLVLHCRTTAWRHVLNVSFYLAYTRVRCSLSAATGFILQGGTGCNANAHHLTGTPGE